MKVKIRKYEDLKNEFGVGEEGHIATTFTFTDYMEEELPEDRIINIVFDREDDCYRWVTENEPSGGWQISTDMIEKVVEYSSNELTQKDFDIYLKLIKEV